MSEKQIGEMSKRELFERVKELDEAIKVWEKDPSQAEDADEFGNVRALMIRDYNDHYDRLFHKMFKKKIFKHISW